MSRESTLRSRVAMVCVALVWLGGFWAARARGEETPEERRKRIESMDPAEKRELRRRQEGFEALSPAEKEQLRQLHQRIEEDPRAEELREVMRRYCEWVNRLPLDYRYELRDLPPDERIKRVKELHKEGMDRRRGPARFRRGPRGGGRLVSRMPQLSEEDRRGVIRWIDDCVDRRAPKLVAALPEDERAQVLQEMEKAKDQEARLAVFARLCRRRFQQGPEKGPLLDDRSVKELEANLSEETRDRLAGMSLDDRRLRLTGMVMRVLPVPDEELAKQMKKLKPEDRKWITSLLPEHQHPWLRFHYFWGRLPGPLPGRGPGPPGRPGGFGPPRGGAKGMQGPGPPPDGQPSPLGAREPPPEGPRKPRGPGSGSSRRD